MKKTIGVLLAFFVLVPSPSVHSATRAEIVSSIVESAAARYGADPEIMWRVLWCESRFNFEVVSPTNDYGIAQINLFWHPEIAIEQAFNPAFAIDFMAREMTAGRADRWTCYRQIFGEIR